jgi:hypothetical protein
MNVLTALALTEQGLCALPPVERVFALQRELEKRVHPSKWTPLPLRHFFADGVYVREISIPAGTVIIGCIHKHEHVAIMVQGDMSLYDETGMHRMKAPHTFISRPGIKRAAYIYEDVIFSTIHRMSAPEERDLLALHHEFYAVTQDEYVPSDESVRALPSLIVEERPPFIREHRQCQVQ